jgi:DNA-binding transcriptional regulator GbsR (MarR family)
MQLTPVSEKFILHWGEMGTQWGVNRSVAQIHALLFLAGRALDAEEIAATLNLARSNVSASLKELQGWQLARVTHQMGDRKDYFETSTDVWELFRLIVQGRRQREIDPTVRVLQDLLASPDLAQEGKGAQQRMHDTLQFIKVLTAWSDEMLRLKPETLMKTLGLGAKISRALRGRKEEKAATAAF